MAKKKTSKRKPHLPAIINRDQSDGFIGECIARNDTHGLLDFLLRCLPDVTLRMNTIKGCIEVYIPDYTSPNYLKREYISKKFNDDFNDYPNTDDPFNDFDDEDIDSPDFEDG